MKLAPMKRSVYSLAPLREVMAAANRRYLEFLSCLDDPSSGVASLDRISQPTHQGTRSYRGFNLLTQTDQQIFEVILQGHFNISGFRNRTLRQSLPDLSPSQVSRLLTRLRLHGLVKKVARQSKYYLTRLGRAVAIAALGLRAFFLLPQLTRSLAARR